MDACKCLLMGKVGWTVGIAESQPIAARCAVAFLRAGVRHVIADLNEKSRPFAEPVAQRFNASQVHGTGNLAFVDAGDHVMG